MYLLQNYHVNSKIIEDLGKAKKIVNKQLKMNKVNSFEQNI